MLRTALKVSDRTIGSVLNTFGRIETGLLLHRHKISQFQPHVQFLFERGNFVVKTAENGDELAACLKLRFEVFHREYMHKRRDLGIDVDHLDLLCDHLIIFDKRQDRIIGTYRLNCTRYNQSFYSAGEFHMERLLLEPGVKLEMGRACISREYRNGAVIALLWRGIAEYLSQTESKMIFGCASVKTIDVFESALLLDYLESTGNVDKVFTATPTKKYRFAGFAEALQYVRSAPEKFQRDSVAESLPTLFTSYLRAGAKICGEPAYDRDFQCIDFLTVLKLENMNPLFLRKYGL